MLRLLVVILCCGSATAAFAQAPAWSVDAADYQYTMSITGTVANGSEPLSNGQDLVAAVVDGEIRGVVGPEAVGGKNVFFLTVYSNVDGETLHFLVYDAATNAVREIKENLVFRSNAIVGSPSEPHGFTTSTGTAVDARSLPSKVVLEQSHPNPFDEAATIRYVLPASAHVRLAIFDLLGRRLTVLVDERQRPGRKQVRFIAPGHLPSGLYLYRLSVGEATEVGRMLLVR